MFENHDPVSRIPRDMYHQDRTADQSHIDLNEPRAQRPNAFNHRFTEADIAQLEQDDLTDPWIVVALQTAYWQNDPQEGEIVGIRREPRSCGNELELTKAVADPLREPLRTALALPSVYTWVCPRCARAHGDTDTSCRRCACERPAFGSYAPDH